MKSPKPSSNEGAIAFLTSLLGRGSSNADPLLTATLKKLSENVVSLIEHVNKLTRLVVQHNAAIADLQANQDAIMSSLVKTSATPSTNLPKLFREKSDKPN